MTKDRKEAENSPEEARPKNVTGAPPDEWGTPEAEVYRERLVRVSADLDNLRKRTRRDMEIARREERKRILRDCLGVLDNLERALNLAGPQPSEWLEGVEATHRQLIDVLKRHGAEPFECLGAHFDPTLHEAVSVVHVPEKEKSEIVDVVQRGYLLDGELLRPAQVIANHENQ
jgi:molecular chaperone GrpE